MRFLLYCGVLVLAIATVEAHAQEQRRVTVMSYNLENLFDNNDNPVREGDNTYLPRAVKGTSDHVALCERNTEPGPRRRECLELDWNDTVLARKLDHLATVIGRFETVGPDILVVQEVENRDILAKLVARLPEPAAYKSILNLDDSPGRGINVGLVSRLTVDPEIPPTSAAISFPTEVTQADGSPCGSTRNLTSFTLRLPDGAPLTIFALHMPAGGSAYPCRAYVAERLVEQVLALPSDRMVVVAGDTNLNCSDEDKQTIADILRPVLVVPDEVNKGCRAPGSSYFGPQGWSFLDLVMTNRPLLSTHTGGASWFADFGSFRTALTAPELQVRTDGRNRVTPRRFSPTEGTGAADHWPVALDLIRRQ